MAVKKFNSETSHHTQCIGIGRRTKHGRSQWAHSYFKATEITVIKCGEAIKAPVHFTARCVELWMESEVFFSLLWMKVCHHYSGMPWKYKCLPVTTVQRSTLVDSCVCCRPASWPGWAAGHSESRPGRLRRSGCFSGHTGPAASAPLLHSCGCTPPTLLQTSWDNTTQGLWINMHGSSITTGPAGIHKWHDNCTMTATGGDSLCCFWATSSAT